MTFLHFKEADGLRAFASLNMPNTFKFIIDNHNYFMPQILADFLSPAVAQMHLIDPTLNYFLISDVSDQNLDFELFMFLASGRTIEITPENCPFIEIVASKLMNEEIVKIASDYLNNIEPITIENAVFRLNQKNNVGILPFCEIHFIAENFWVINPNHLFQINLKDLNLILSNPKLKILNEDWLFRLILRIIKDKGEEYLETLSYVSFKDLSMDSLKKYFEKSENNQTDEFILRSVRKRLISKNENIEHQSHLKANQSEINYVYQKSKTQKDHNGYSFNSEFFNEYHLYHDQQAFDFISSLFDNTSSTSSSSAIYNFNNKFNPFEPNPKKTFPDYYSKLKNEENQDNEKDEKKRNPLIQDDDDYPFLSMPVNIQYSGKSEQIPINFTKKDNFYFSSSSSDDEKYNENSQSLFGRIANQVFHNSQKIFDSQDQKETGKDNNESNEENTKNQDGLFTSLKNGLLSFFTPSNQVEPENIIPRDEELTSFKPEPIAQNQRDFEHNRRWPYPQPQNYQNAQDDNNNNENNEEDLVENAYNNDNHVDDRGSNFHISVHDENGKDDRIKIDNNNNDGVALNRNETTGNEHNKSDDDSDMDGYGGFTKEQY